MTIVTVIDSKATVSITDQPAKVIVLPSNATTVIIESDTNLAITKQDAAVVVPTVTTATVVPAVNAITVEISSFVSPSTDILESERIIDVDYELSAGKNGLSVGIVQVAAPYTVEVPGDAAWAIV